MYVFYVMSAFLCLTICHVSGQTSDADRYWIKENFATFSVQADYLDFDTAYLTSPNQVALQAYYANTELAEGTCGIDPNISDNHFRIRGLKDNGWASFTIPNADTVIINLRGKSHSRDRVIKIFKNDELVETFSEMDEDTCVTFTDIAKTADSVTYKITGGDVTSTKPIVVYGIEVSKFITDGISDVQQNANHIVIYPNPAHNTLYMQTHNLTVKNMEIYNLQGQSFPVYTHHDSELQIDISHLSSGIYILKMNTPSAVLFSKFIKL